MSIESIAVGSFAPIATTSTRVHALSVTILRTRQAAFCLMSQNTLPDDD